MEKDLGNYRKSYEKSALTEDTISTNPIAQFENWFQAVESVTSIEEPNAMTISTMGLDGYPKNRVVLLKKYSDEGFIFYTNYSSEKGRAIAANPKVSLSFFWPALERQVIIKGEAEKVSVAQSNAYFKSRPERSKLGAVVSNQSQVIASRELLEKKLELLENELKGQEIQCPTHWGGYLVRHISVEFWQGRRNRLHDRIRYIRNQNGEWKIERLAP